MRPDPLVQFLQATIRHAPGPLYLAIANAIGQAVTARTLASGDRLPPQRHLADALQVNLTTVSRAYAEAQRRQILEARVGRGTFVRLAPEPSPPGPPALALAPVDMSMNLPPQPQHPALRTLLQDSLADVLAHADMRTLMTYRAGAGSLRDRAAAAAWLHPVLSTVDPDRVLVCAGAQSAMTALLTTLARPGDTILTEPLTYPGFRALAAQLGLRLAPVLADDDGLLPEALERACQTLQPRAIYCVPTIHNPTTVTMPLVRRQAVAEIALRHGVPIVEDDAYGLLPSHRLPAMTALVAGCGYHVASLSKCLSPGLRTAFVTTPGRTEASRLVEAVRATSLTPSPLMISLVTHWIESGSAEALCVAIRQEASARQDIARTVLAGAAIAVHPEGLHVWLTLPAQWHRTDFIAHVRQRGLALVASDSFAVAESPPNAVRICLGVAETRESVRAALLALADALQMNAPTHLAEIV